jgi:hypothetical protein
MLPGVCTGQMGLPPWCLPPKQKLKQKQIPNCLQQRQQPTGAETKEESIWELSS